MKLKTLLKSIKGMWRNPPKGRFLSIKEIGNYCMYSFGTSCIINVVNYVATVAFIPYFYGIDTIHAYIIVALGSILNILFQSLIGNAIDKTNTKLGRYKPYILFTLPLFALFTILVTWIPQFESLNSKIIYAYLICVPVLALSTFYNNMYQTMPSVITPVSQERSDIMSPVSMLFGLAPTILQLIAGPVRGHFKSQGMEFMGMRILGIISVIIGILGALFILKVKERYYSDNDCAEAKTTFAEALCSLSKNKPLIILCTALVLGSLREFSTQFRFIIIQFRFSADVKSAIDISGIPMTIIGFASFVAMIVTPILTRKMDKHKIIIMFSMLGVGANAALGIVGYENIPIGATSAIVVTGLHFISMITPVFLLIPAMLGEIADYQQLKGGKRLEGHLQNLLFTIPLLFSQIFMICAWFWQRKIGFEAKDYAGLTVLTAQQQHVACQWFDAVSIIAAVSGILMIITLCFYPLSKTKHAEVVQSLSKVTVLSNMEENMN